MADTRLKNANWSVGDGTGRARSIDHVVVAVLMDIRDELQTLNAATRCFRIPRALDGMYELGLEARRRKRTDAARRKAAKQKGVK